MWRAICDSIVIRSTDLLLLFIANRLGFHMFRTPTGSGMDAYALFSLPVNQSNYTVREYKRFLYFENWSKFKLIWIFSNWQCDVMFCTLLAYEFEHDNNYCMNQKTGRHIFPLLMGGCEGASCTPTCYRNMCFRTCSICSAAAAQELIFCLHYIS